MQGRAEEWNHPTGRMKPAVATLLLPALRALAVAVLGATVGGSVPLAGQAPDRLWGEVLTTSGERLTGYLRWDRNEAGWWDHLEGRRARDPELLERIATALGDPVEDRRRSVEFLGVRISWNEDVDDGAVSSGVAFGHLREVRPLGDDAATLVLRDGSEVEVRATSTDLGSGLRELRVEVPGADTRELSWGELERIRFGPVPADAPEPASPRLHGTLEDRWGGSWTGDLSWDRDEVLAGDVLDGAEDGEDREISFALVSAVERRFEGGARVLLRDGGELVLTDSNDVDRGHRGVQVSDPRLGLIDVPWSAVSSVRFHPPATRRGYDQVAPVGPLAGTVLTADGTVHRGRIFWDADESVGWELLDGEYRDLVFAVEFAHIRSIERATARAASVELRDGRVLRLEGGNDVGRDNRGIVVEGDDGSLTVIRWRDFRRLELETGR